MSRSVRRPRSTSSSLVSSTTAVCPARADDLGDPRAHEAAPDDPDRPNVLRAHRAPCWPCQGASVQSGTLLEEKVCRVREEPRLRGLPTFGLAMAGLVLGHVLAYLIAVPDPHHRAFVLQRTGHEYLPAAAEAGLVLALAGMAAVVIRAFGPGPRGGSDRFSRLAGSARARPGAGVRRAGGRGADRRGGAAPTSDERPHPGDRHGDAGPGRARRGGVPPVARANLEQARRDGPRPASRCLEPGAVLALRAHRGVPAPVRSARPSTSEPRPPPESPLRRSPAWPSGHARTRLEVRPCRNDRCVRCSPWRSPWR